MIQPLKATGVIRSRKGTVIGGIHRIYIYMKLDYKGAVWGPQTQHFDFGMVYIHFGMVETQV